MLRVHTHTYILYYTIPREDNSTNTPFGRRLELLGFILNLLSPLRLRLD